MILVERDGAVIQIPDCICVHKGKARVIEHPWCPHPGHGGKRSHWRVLRLRTRKPKRGK